MSSSWWADKLNNRPAPRTSTPPVAPSRPFPVAIPQANATVAQRVSYDPVADQTVTPSSHKSGTCPECYSMNYLQTGTGFSSTGSFPVMRCYDCGYPLVQSTSGVNGMSSDGPVRASRQSSTVNNYNPRNIVGRIQ